MWCSHPNKFLPAEKKLLSHVAELLCPPAGTSQGPCYLHPAADHPQMPRNYVEQLYASCGEIPLPLDLQIFSSLYVLQQLFNTTKSQVFHAPPQDSVTQNSAHVLYSEKSVTGEQGLKSCHSPVNASRCLQPLLDCFTFWQYGRRNFSPPILHALTCKSQPEYWHLQTRVRVFHVFFTS